MFWMIYELLSQHNSLNIDFDARENVIRAEVLSRD